MLIYKTKEQGDTSMDREDMRTRDIGQEAPPKQSIPPAFLAKREIETS